MHQLISITEVDRIASLPNPRLRNFLITQSYHELSLELAQHLGRVANWCTFASWASRQAGQSIRKEDLQHALENYLHTNPLLIQTILDRVNGTWKKGATLNKGGVVRLILERLNPEQAMNRASDAVARGNQKVYAEIAREFARFLDTCLQDQAFRAETIQHFCNTLRPGNPPEGQVFLQQAFQHYYAASFETDEKQKAELILMANIKIGFHEQTRLQPEIAEAMEAALLDAKTFRTLLINALVTKGSFIQRFYQWCSPVLGFLRELFGMPSPLDKAIDDLVQKTRQRTRLFLSAHLMELGFPNGLRMPLGKDLSAHFPAHLQSITHPELIQLLKEVDPTPDSLRETGARDWADLKERLHFIADLFRCFQENADLFAPPLDDVTLAEMA